MHFQLAFALFALVAAGGVLMFLMLAFRRNIPGWLGAAHGLAGLISLAYLFFADLQGAAQTPPLAWWALGVLVSGFVGGLLLFRVIFKNRATIPLATVHGSVGTLGLYLLYRAAF